MIDLKQFVINPYVGFQKVFCFDKRLTIDEFIVFIRTLEFKTGLHFIADKPDDLLHGFATMCPMIGSKCTWGDHFKEGDHTSIILSLYDKDKEPNEESEATFRKVEVTEELEEHIDMAYKIFNE